MSAFGTNRRSADFPLKIASSRSVAPIDEGPLFAVDRSKAAGPLSAQSRHIEYGPPSADIRTFALGHLADVQPVTSKHAMHEFDIYAEWAFNGNISITPTFAVGIPGAGSRRCR